MKAMLVLVSLLLSSLAMVGCTAVAEGAAAKSCADWARGNQSDDSLREIAQDHPIDGMTIDEVVAFLKDDAATSMAAGWTSCMGEKGFRCSVEDLLDSSVPAARTCDGENVIATNPFYEKALEEAD
jgi:hypothetical protein